MRRILPGAPRARGVAPPVSGLALLAGQGDCLAAGSCSALRWPGLAACRRSAAAFAAPSRTRLGEEPSGSLCSTGNFSPDPMRQTRWALLAQALRQSLKSWQWRWARGSIPARSMAAACPPWPDRCAGGARCRRPAPRAVLHSTKPGNARLPKGIAPARGPKQGARPGLVCRPSSCKRRTAPGVSLPCAIRRDRHCAAPVSLAVICTLICRASDSDSQTRRSQGQVPLCICCALLLL